MTTRPYERVFTMTEYYDGPRSGIANFGGRPHAYDSAYGDQYELRAVDDDTFRMAVEDWGIWLRWEDAFYAGTATQDSHPALPVDRARHDELAPVLWARLDALPGPAIRARAVFRPGAGHEHGGRGRWLEVQWTPL